MGRVMKIAGGVYEMPDRPTHCGVKVDVVTMSHTWWDGFYVEIVECRECGERFSKEYRL